MKTEYQYLKITFEECQYSIKLFFNFHQTLASVVRNEYQSPKCHKSTNNCVDHKDSANSQSAFE